MKKALIWTTAGIAAIGFAVPAFAAHGDAPRPARQAPVATVVTSATTPSNTVTSVSVARSSTSTPDSAEDISGPCDEAEHANDSRCTGVTASPVTTDPATDDTTTNSIEDVSGPCDEAEHANDPRCATQDTITSDDNSGHRGSENSGRGGLDDNSGHRGGDDS